MVEILPSKYSSLSAAWFYKYPQLEEGKWYEQVSSQPIGETVVF